MNKCNSYNIHITNPLLLVSSSDSERGFGRNVYGLYLRKTWRMK